MSRLLLPRNTIRMRLTALYGGLFLACGTGLLAIVYVLVKRRYSSDFFVAQGKIGLAVNLKTIDSGGTTRFVTGPPGGAKFTPQQLIAQAHAQSAAAIHQLLVNSAIALGIMALLAIWLGWLVAGRALRPLRTITNAAREISASNLHRRLALEGPDDELKQLGTTFDGLLARLESSFDAQRQFVANASHELRTPLTYERAVLEVALADPAATVASLRETCRQVLEAGAQQERLIEALLTLSRGQRGLDRREPVELAEIAAAAVAGVEHDGLAFETQLAPAGTTGDPRLVERLAANLVGNAVSHNVPNGRVTVATARRNGTAVLSVANTGPRVPEDQLPRLFRPFQRLEPARTGGTEGLGLGLSIVDAIASAHGATVAASAPAEGGLRVEVSFPAAPARVSRR